MLTNASRTVCPLCSSAQWYYLFSRHGARVYRCSNCTLTRQKVGAEGVDELDGNQNFSSPTEQEAAAAYWRLLHTLSPSGSRILLIAPREHPFAALAAKAGRLVEHRFSIHELAQAALPANHFDSAVVLFQIEESRDPIDALKRLRTLIKPDGLLLLVTPSLDSWPARFFRSQWTEWQSGRVYYFDSQTIQSALLRAGFEHIRIRPDRRRYTPDHLNERARAFPRTMLTRAIQLVYLVAPTSVRRTARIRLTTSCMVVTAQPAEQRTRPRLSIIMPVYNERASFEATLNEVIAKSLPDLDKEIVIVESNSTDGTRELASRYQHRPNVKLLLENRPYGKGHAVRTGLAHATGDYVLIQDADREYDVNDYEALIQPLVTYRSAFVLGSRHSGDWKIRHFNDQLGIATFFNVGHWLFTAAINFLFGQRLRDPFTMYKVFRRDCLYGLEFESNRFDLDFELVIKLLRKGYTPLEIPVNYHARSFTEGKKVSPVRDPITWLRALIKYRIQPLYREKP